jgi:hypothetical protein
MGVVHPEGSVQPARASRLLLDEAGYHRPLRGDRPKSGLTDYEKEP